MKAKSYMPSGRHTVTPFLVVRKAGEAIDFYVKAFGAEELMRFYGPDGQSIAHAQIKIGDSTICLCEEDPQCQSRSPESLGGVASSLYLYVPDVDASFKQAVDAGCSTKMAPFDMFWGDRFASVQDPFGHVWSLATHVEDLTAAEIKQAMDSFFGQMAAGAKS